MPMPSHPTCRLSAALGLFDVCDHFAVAAVPTMVLCSQRAPSLMIPFVSPSPSTRRQWDPGVPKYSKTRWGPSPCLTGVAMASTMWNLLALPTNPTTSFFHFLHAIPTNPMTSFFHFSHPVLSHPTWLRDTDPDDLSTDTMTVTMMRRQWDPGILNASVGVPQSACYSLDAYGTMF